LQRKQNPSTSTLHNSHSTKFDEKKEKNGWKITSPGLTFSAADVDSKHHPFSHPVGYGWIYGCMKR